MSFWLAFKKAALRVTDSREDSRRPPTHVVVEVSDKSESGITEFFEKAGFKIEFERRFDEGEIFYKNIIFTRK